MSEPDLQEVHDFLITIAHKAGDMIRDPTPTTSETLGTKKNSADLVTETDQAVEKMVSTELKRKYPDFDFMGEETYKPGDRISAKPTFVVDPIDGTTNFFHGHPYVCICMGLAVERKPVVGVTYNPFTRQLYTGIKGKGSYLTEPSHEGPQRLPLRNPEALTELSKCLVGVEWGSDRSGNDFDVKCATFRNLTASKESGGAMVHGIRSLGSADINLCGVAAGHLDMYWESGCWAWDVCAGWVILEEAGGRMVGANKGDWAPELEQRRYLGVRGDGAAKGPEEGEKGREALSEGQRKVVEEFWGCVEGTIRDVGWDNVTA